jgi:hypothetical protein
MPVERIIQHEHDGLMLQNKLRGKMRNKPENGGLLRPCFTNTMLDELEMVRPLKQ